MTNPPEATRPTDVPAPEQTPKISLPGIAVFLFTVSPLALLLGLMIFGGTTSRRFFEGAPFQATLGIMVFVTGLLALFAGFVLVGVRTIAQRHLEAMHTEKYPA